MHVLVVTFNGCMESHPAPEACRAFHASQTEAAFSYASELAISHGESDARVVDLSRATDGGVIVRRVISNGLFTIQVTQCPVSAE